MSYVVYGNVKDSIKCFGSYPESSKAQAVLNELKKSNPSVDFWVELTD